MAARPAQALLRAKDAEVAAVRAEAAASVGTSPSAASLQAEIAQLKQLMETAAEVAAQQLLKQHQEAAAALHAAEAEAAQAKSAAQYHQMLAQETATSLEELRAALGETEEALHEARAELKVAAAAQQRGARQRGQLSVLKEEDAPATPAALGGSSASAAAGDADVATLQQEKQLLVQQVELLQLQLSQLQV